MRDKVSDRMSENKNKKWWGSLKVMISNVIECNLKIVRVGIDVSYSKTRAFDPVVLL